jgi:hypothetical protein
MEWIVNNIGGCVVTVLFVIGLNILVFVVALDDRSNCEHDLDNNFVCRKCGMSL